MRTLVLLRVALLVAVTVPASIVRAQGCAGAPAVQTSGRAGDAVPTLTAAEPMGPVENLTAYPMRS